MYICARIWPDSDVQLEIQKHIKLHIECLYQRVIKKNNIGNRKKFNTKGCADVSTWNENLNEIHVKSEFKEHCVNCCSS